MKIHKNSVRAVAELMIAAIFWGFGFTATIWSLQVIDAFEISALRFAIGFLTGLIFLVPTLKQTPLKQVLRWSFLPAILLSGTLILQTWGLHYTTATKSGFITTLYVVFVPLLEALHLKRRIPLSLWLCVLGAFVGTLLIVNIGLNGVNLGDGLTFLCALVATFQIYYLGLLSPKIQRPFLFNTLQSGWSVLMCLPFFFHNGLLHKLGAIGEWPPTAVFGMLSLAFGSTVLAFFLQVKAQAFLSPTVASLLCLLESPFAMIFAAVLLGESLGPLEAGGAALIFVSAAGASVIESKS